MTNETRAYTVEGMNCGHCRNSILEEVGGIAGVDLVEVDLESGRLEVRGEVSDEVVEAAVREAGFELATKS